MNVVSNLVFNRNNCDANKLTALVTIGESTAAGPMCGLLNAKFTFKGTSRRNRLYTDRSANECLTTLLLTVFTQRNFAADSSSEVRFCPKIGRFVFLSTLWGLRNSVQCSSWAHWKERGGLPISISLIELLC